MRSKNACKTCALGMGGQTGGMVNEAGHFPEVCKKSLQAMAADMQGAIKPEFFEHVLARRSCRPSRRASWKRCGRLTQPVLLDARRSNTTGRSRWDEAFDADRRQAASRSRPTKRFWYFSGRSSNEAGFLLQLFARLYGTNNVNNCSYYCHQASGVGLDQRARQRHGDGHAGRCRARRPGVRHRRQPGQQSSAADAHADARPPPRRRGDRHQPGRRDRAGQLSRAQRRAQPAVRHARSPACTCSRTSAATWRC